VRLAPKHWRSCRQSVGRTGAIATKFLQEMCLIL
jgi:hypothetical protein